MTIDRKMLDPTQKAKQTKQTNKQKIMSRQRKVKKKKTVGEVNLQLELIPTNQAESAQ